MKPLITAGLSMALVIVTGISGRAGDSESLVHPESVGMSSVRLAHIAPVIENAVKNKDLPGAVVVVGRKNHIVYRKAFGFSSLEPQSREMTVDMIFDLASLTKPVATAASLMILVEQGQIRLWDKVSEFVPGFSRHIDVHGNTSNPARIGHLLTHTSGLPGYVNKDEMESVFGDFCATPGLVRYIANMPKESPPGEKFIYSCLGFITLAHIIEQISGKTIDEFAEEHIFRPLAMHETFFRPPDEIRPRCVPTERVNGIVLQGVVHDPLARLQGGVSGNAGLFSTADDLTVFARMMLNEGKYQGVRVLSPLTVRRMTEIYPLVEFSGRGLGWDLDSPYSTNGGDLFGSRSYGHTGYTGTSMWIDPETETYVIFLTNSVHPDDLGDVISLRSRVANVVASALIDLD
ncbi:MAG: serine hydrolase domain-containing protein [Candidatus Aminicenantaceae bacterium]